MNPNPETNLSPFSSQPPVSSPSQKEQEYEAFIGSKYQSYYKAKFESLESSKPKGGFNIAAFFFGALWLFYRKMYAYGFLYLGFVLVSTIITTMLNASEAVDRGISIGLAVMMGFSGNAIYKSFIDKKLKTSNMSLDEIQKQGGTNIIASIILLLVAVSLISFGLFLGDAS